MRSASIRDAEDGDEDGYGGLGGDSEDEGFDGSEGAEGADAESGGQVIATWGPPPGCWMGWVCGGLPHGLLMGVLRARLVVVSTYSAS